MTALDRYRRYCRYGHPPVIAAGCAMPSELVLCAAFVAALMVGLFS